MRKKSHFLSRVEAEGEKRTAVRREVRLECVLYYMRNGLRGYSSQKGKVLNISESGCLVTCALPKAVAPHFYLVIKGVPVKFSCAIKEVQDRGIHTSFLQDLPKEVIDRLAKSHLE
jgi:hypothetical protein